MTRGRGLWHHPNKEEGRSTAMKAWVLRSIGEINYSDAKIPVPKKDEVLIRVKAAGICGSDIPRIYETGAHNMPLVPGHEFSGVVEELGKNVDPSWRGKRVAVFPKIACGKCPSCRKGLFDDCQNYDYVGSRRDGAFAEFVTSPAANLIGLSDTVSFEEGAMTEPLAVAANAVRRGCLASGTTISPDSPVAVCGLGTIGVMVVMFLKEAGFEKIYAIGNKEAQKERLKPLGIPEERFINSRSTDVPQQLLELTDGGVSAFFECVGKNECINYGIESTAPVGRLVLVGNPYSDMAFPRDVYWKILRKQLSLVGIWNSSFRQVPDESGRLDDWHYVLDRVAESRISPKILISHRLPLSELETGLHIMRDKTEDYCKVMTLSG